MAGVLIALYTMAVVSIGYAIGRSAPGGFYYRLWVQESELSARMVALATRNADEIRRLREQLHRAGIDAAGVERG